MNTPSAKGSAIRSQEHPHEDAYADGLQLVWRVQRLAGEESARQRAEGPGDEVHHGDDEANEGNAHTNERGSYQGVLLLLMLTPYSHAFPRFPTLEGTLKAGDRYVPVPNLAREWSRRLTPLPSKATVTS